MVQSNPCLNANNHQQYATQASSLSPRQCGDQVQGDHTSRSMVGPVATRQMGLGGYRFSRAGKIQHQDGVT